MVSDGRRYHPAHMTTSEVTDDAIKIMGEFKRNEEALIEQVKQLEKSDKHYLQRVFSTQIEGWTPFHAFVLRGARKLVKIALRCGVNANLPMGEPQNLPGGCTPLHLAAHRGDVSIIQLLVQHNANINKTDASGKTPVFYAASRQNTYAVKKLLKEGADIGEVDRDQLLLLEGCHERRFLGRVSTFLCINKSTLL